jgi:predicted MFS family arabinose efflux permease
MVLPHGHRRDFAPVTAPQKFRAGCYTLEGLNSFAVVIYFNYLYFFFRDHFGFSDRQNLLLAAGIGLVYTIASWQAGRFAQRCGYFNALKMGFGVMAAGLAAGSQLHSVPGNILAACVVNLGMCCIWPTLEALVSEGETPEHVPHAVGLYNITWAATNATAFFIGGTLIEKLGFQCIFYVPLAVMLLQLGLVFGLEKIQPRKSGTGISPVGLPAADRGQQTHRRDACATAPARAKNFQRMAWLANPFAYVAINTLLAVLPGIAAKFHLSPMLAGFACSLWCFVRLGAFIVLWRWTGWHYRFRWLVTAFALLIVSFTAVLVAPNIAVLLVAQMFFGVAIGLIYYSSLFYSLDASDKKSEHGGIHEAAIGVGNCLGPAAGAAALWLAPQNASVGAWAVSGLLTIGLGGLLWLRQHPPKPAR